MKIETASALQLAILELENQKKLQKRVLTDEFNEVLESLKPTNIITNFFNNIRSSPTLSNTLFKAGIGTITGIITKKLVVGKTNSFLGKIIGNALKFGVGRVVYKNSDKIKAIGHAVYKNFFKAKPEWRN